MENKKAEVNEEAKRRIKEWLDLTIIPSSLIRTLREGDKRGELESRIDKTLLYTAFTVIEGGRLWIYYQGIAKPLYNLFSN